MTSKTDLLLIRHAEADAKGRLCGRRDVGLSRAGAGTLAALQGRGRAVAEVRSSPALRCRLTASALWPDATLIEDARLWEQDFGAWDGQPYEQIPDMGDLSGDALVDLAAPDGESFRDLCARTEPALRAAARQARSSGPVAIVAHAGTIRAALAMALNRLPEALLFEVAPLSLTVLSCLPEGFAIRSVNGPLP